MKGTWQGSGTWQTGGGGGAPVVAIAACAVAAIAVASFLAWLAAHLLAIALILAALVAALAGTAVYLRRRPDRDAELLAGRIAAVRAAAAESRRIAAPESLTVINVHPGAHLHLEGSAGAAGIISQAPVPGAVIREEDSWHYP